VREEPTLDPGLYRRLAGLHGTPLFVYDGRGITGALAELHRALPAGVEVFYSLKANPNISVCSLLAAHGAHAEVSSLTELETAVAAGVAPRDIIFLGPGKSRQELSACIDAGIYAVVAESFGELAELNRLAARAGTRQRVLLRVNPAGATPGMRLAMGGRPRQFGIDEAQLMTAGPLGPRYSALRLAGWHGYLGTRILDPATVVGNTARLLALAERLSSATGVGLEALDVGGGLGVAYHDGEQDPDLAELSTGLDAVVRPFRRRHPRTRLLFESGRYLVARAGVYLTAVRYVKESMGQRFAVVDGGTHQHMAAVGVTSVTRRNFPVLMVERGAEPPVGDWQLAGSLCTPNDTIARNVPLPELRPGDLIAILRSGAYGPTASPAAFLGQGAPAEVLVHEGRSLLVRDRDTAADLLRKQRHYTFATDVPALAGT